MGFFGSIKALFGKKEAPVEDALALAAISQTTGNGFFEALAQSNIFVVIPGSPMPEPWTEAEALKCAELDMKKLSGIRSVGDVKDEIFRFAVEGRSVMPIFSSQAETADFTKTASDERLVDRPTSFLGLDCEFAYLLNYEFDQFVFALNPGKPSYRLFGQKERKFMRNFLDGKQV